MGRSFASVRQELKGVAEALGEDCAACAKRSPGLPGNCWPGG